MKYLYALCVKVVNVYVDLVYIYSCSFLYGEADLMGNAVYGSSDICAIGHFDMEVDDETAVLIGTYEHTLVLSESPACGKSRNSRTECAYIADICRSGS